MSSRLEGLRFLCDTYAFLPVLDLPTHPFSMFTELRELVQVAANHCLTFCYSVSAMTNTVHPLTSEALLSHQ